MSIETQGLPMPKLPRTAFSRSKKRIGTYRVGNIYPIYSKIVKPNDHISVDVSMVARKLPTIAPSFAEERIVGRAFFVPLRTLWKDWENWQTGYKKYSDETPFNKDVPRWTPSNCEKTNPSSLWAHLGYPINCYPEIMPADFKRQAYAWIGDTFFRYRPIEESILDDGEPGTWKGEDLLVINKDRDFFTTGLPKQQLGAPVSLPITGNTTTEFNQINNYNKNIFTDLANGVSYVGIEDVGNSTASIQEGNPGGSKKHTGRRATSKAQADEIAKMLVEGIDEKTKILNELLRDNVVQLNNVSSATISMIRHAFARQIQAENLARAGVFYPDVLMMNWGTAPSDEILGLPQYLGGFTINMVNSEVLQTSQTSENSPLGEMGGHSLGVGKGSSINCYAKEFGVFMIVIYIKPENFYAQQGMPWEDEFVDNECLGWIAFQHMSEQPVAKRQVLTASRKYPYWDENNKERKFGNDDPTASKYNNDTFMFQPIYENMRTDWNDVVGLMVQEQLYSKEDGTGDMVIKNNLYNWTQASFFNIKDGSRPAFNSEFLKVKEDNRNYAVKMNTQGLPEDNYIIWMDIKANWVSVLDRYGMPGQLDHLGEI